MNNSHTISIGDFSVFLEKSPTMFHAARNIEMACIEKGCALLREEDTWVLEPGRGYVVTRGDSLVAAFRVGMKQPSEAGFRMAGAHLDSPGFRVKPDSESVVKGLAKIGVEVYGGPVYSTWLDRDISIAGRVMVKGSKGWESRLLDFNRPVALIPNLAIHLNREVNKGFEYNPQNHLSPVIAADVKEGEKNILRSMIAAELGVEIESVGEYDLYLYDCVPPQPTGRNGELFSGPRLDNLGSSHAILTAFLETGAADHTSIALFYDNEEIGSRTPQGADSSFTRNLLERIVTVLGGSKEDFFRSLSLSFLISADCAHGWHPNFGDKHDAAYTPLLNGGPCIKFNANCRYATTAETSVYFETLCEKAGVPCQKIINRSDIPTGSTIGPMSSAHLSVKTVDVGNPMWAMHSIRETVGSYDHGYLIKALSLFFGG